MKETLKNRKTLFIQEITGNRIIEEINLIKYYKERNER